MCFNVASETVLCSCSVFVFILELKTTEEEYNKCVVPNEDQVSSYYKIRQQLDHLSKELMTYVQKPQYIIPFLQPGRLVHVKNGEDDYHWGMVVNFQKKANQSNVSIAIF